MMKTIRQFWAAVLCAVMVLIGLLFFMGRAQSQAFAQGQVTPSPTPGAGFQRTVSVNGAGSVSVQPDLAIIDLGVTTDAATASEALTQNSKQMQTVMDALTKAKIAAADIHTQSVQLYPRYDTTNPTPVAQGQSQPQAEATPANRVTGYTAANVVEVTVRNLANLGTVLDQVVSAGSNTIQGIRFDVSNQSQAMDQARQAAMQDATHKAQQLVTLANVKLGTVVSINESSSVPVPFMADRAAAQSAAAVPVSPGSQLVTVNLQVTWELTP